MCSSHGAMGPGPANLRWLETSWTRAASWQHALSHVQSDLMLHHSRGVTQEELGLTLSGGVWFGHPPHYCPPSLPAHVGLSLMEGDFEAFAGSRSIAIRGCGLWRLFEDRESCGRKDPWCVQSCHAWRSQIIPTRL